MRAFINRVDLRCLGSNREFLVFIAFLISAAPSAIAAPPELVEARWMTEGENPTYLDLYPFWGRDAKTEIHVQVDLRSDEPIGPGKIKFWLDNPYLLNGSTGNTSRGIPIKVEGSEITATSTLVVRNQIDWAAYNQGDNLTLKMSAMNTAGEEAVYDLGEIFLYGAKNGGTLPDLSITNGVSSVEINSGLPIIISQGFEGSVSVPVTAMATDLESGIESIRLRYRNGDILSTRSFNFHEGHLIDGTLEDGIYRQSFSVSKFSVPGIYNLTRIFVTDKAGNQIEIDPVDAPEAIQKSFEIKNPNVDGVPPELVESVRFRPLMVDVTDEPVELTFIVTLKDDHPGFNKGSISIFHSTAENEEEFGSDFYEANRISGNEFLGTYEVKVTVPQGILPGEYHYQVEAQAGNGEIATWGRATPYTSYDEKKGHPNRLPEKSNEVLTIVSGISPPIDNTPPEGIFEFSVNDGEAIVIPADFEGEFFQYPTSVRAVDSGSGVQEIRLTYQRGEEHFLYFYFDEDDRIFGTLKDGKFERDFGARRLRDSGTYELSSISVSDKAGNQSRGSIEGAPEGIQKFIEIVNPQADEVPPEIVGPVTVTPLTADITDGSVELTFSLTLKDEYPGIRGAKITVFNSSNPRAAEQIGFLSQHVFSNESTLISGDEFMGTYEVAVEIPPGQIPGEYSYQIEVTDNSFNTSIWGALRQSDLHRSDPVNPNPLPPDSTEMFTVVDNGDVTDTSPPEEISDILVNSGETIMIPEELLEPYLIPVSVKAADSDSGIEFVELLYKGHGTSDLYFNFSQENLISGTSNNGVYQRNFEITKFTNPGTYNLVSITARDVLGNQIVTKREALSTITQKTFEIVNPHFDGILPELIGPVTVIPLFADTVNESVEITFNFTIKEDSPGIRNGNVSIFHTNDPNQSHLGVKFDSSHLVSGDEMLGTYEVKLTIPNGQTSGEYAFQIHANPGSNEWRTWGSPHPPSDYNENPFQPDALPDGSISIFTVESDPNDKTPPVLEAIEVECSHDFETGPGEIDVTLTISDDRTPLSEGGFVGGGDFIRFISPSGATIVEQSFASTSLVEGDLLSGTYSFKVSLDQAIEPGPYLISVQLTNEAGLVTTYGLNDGDSPFPNGFSGYCEITNTGPVDYTPPNPVEFSVVPENAFIGSDLKLDISTRITDSGTGLASGRLSLFSGIRNLSTMDFLPTDLQSGFGDKFDGTFDFEIELPKERVNGAFLSFKLTLGDSAGNFRTYDSGLNNYVSFTGGVYPLPFNIAQVKIHTIVNEENYEAFANSSSSPFPPEATSEERAFDFDYDGDSQSNSDEAAAGTNPTRPDDFFRVSVGISTNGDTKILFSPYYPEKVEYTLFKVFQGGESNERTSVDATHQRHNEDSTFGCFVLPPNQEGFENALFLVGLVRTSL